MSKPRPARLPWDARAADVLAGRARLDAAPLIALVNEVNPTGRGRDAQESAARYALKARLQSLLVARFPESLEVAAEPSQEGVVSIRHRVHRDAACHAVLDTLDDEARSWVQRALDTGGAPDSAPPAGDVTPRRTAAEDEDDPDSADPEALLRAAEEAEAAYDFERAGQLHGRAFRVRRDARAALAYLRFLVDAMAADADALALADELPPAALAHAGVRVLLGLAAARSGDDARAVGLVSRLAEPRAAEVLALVARSALSRGDADAAALRLAEAGEVDPAYPELRLVAEALERLREAQRAPREAELASLLAAGREGEALVLAEAILARWPASEAARRAARTLEARRQTEEGRRLLADADALRAQGERAAALARYRRALATRLDPGEQARAARAAAEIEAEQREHEATLQVERVTAALDAADPEWGLAAYAEADEEIRRRARARLAGADPPRAGGAALEAIDAMLRAGVRARAALDAALALGRATTSLEAEPAAVPEILAAHERALASVPAARHLEARARERTTEERRRRALADLAGAEDALAAGDASLSDRLLERAGRDLGAESLARAAALRARLAAHAEQRLLEKRFTRARAAHRHADAQRAAEALAASGDEAAAARWSAVARSYPDEVRRERRLRVFDFDGDEGAACRRGSHLSTWPPAVHACVDLERQLVVLPMAASRAVFVRWFALDTGRLVRAVHLVAPEPLDEPKIELSGESALVMGGGNGVLELSLATGDLLRWIHLRDRTRMERAFSHAVQPVPGGGHLWVVHSGDLTEGSVYELAGERFLRAIPGADEFHLLRGVAPPRVAAVRNGNMLGPDENNVVSLHEPGGSQAAHLDFPHTVYALVPHPAGEGLVVFGNRHQPYPQSPALFWIEVSAQGKHLRTGNLPGAAGYPRIAAARARDAGMVFLSFHTLEDGRDLVAMVPEPDGALRIAYRVPFGLRRILVQDPEGRRVFAVEEHDDGLEVIALGAAPPALPDRGMADRFTPPMSGISACMQPRRERSTRALEWFVAHFKWTEPPEIRARAAALRAEHEGDRAALVDLFWAHALSYDVEGAAAFAAWLHGRYPEDAEVVQTQWAALVVQRRWDAIRETLGPLDAATLPPEARKHWHHLLAAACFDGADVAAGQRHLEEAEALEGKCDLGALRALGAALAADAPAGDVPRSLPDMEQLVAVVRAADAHLARSDHEGVIALFDRALHHRIREAQGLARLATAHLARPAQSPAERLQKSLALATFQDSLNEPRVGYRAELLLAGATWPEDRLAALAAQAEAWLAEGRD
jgi:hypothetical protein